MKTGIELIADERARQIAKEGCTPEHDDEHGLAELLDAAVLYIDHAAFAVTDRPFAPVLRGDGAPLRWPWDAEWWKPRDPIANLVRAGALVAAEIDRLQRAAEHSPGEGRAVSHKFITHWDGVLHILRNPHGFTENVVRQARLDGADRIEALDRELAEADRLVREIHQALKRRERTTDHGLVGNLKCILEHVSRDVDPDPI